MPGANKLILLAMLKQHWRIILGREARWRKAFVKFRMLRELSAERRHEKEILGRLSPVFLGQVRRAKVVDRRLDAARLLGVTAVAFEPIIIVRRRQQRSQMPAR